MTSTIDVSVSGLAVTHVWHGYGQALFVELGQLTPSDKVRRDGTSRNPTGQVSIEFHGGWRIEIDRRIGCGDKAEPDEIERIVASLMGRTAAHLTTMGQLPEIVLALNGGYRLVSFTATAGDPDWAVVDRRAGPARWFDVRDGAISLGDGGPVASVS